jgi:hypothetical protein
MLQRPTYRVAGNNKKGTMASSYNGLMIDIPDVHVWEDFITCEDVEKLWEETSELESAFWNDMSVDDTDRIMFKEPIMGGIYDEMGLEKKWSTIQAEINLALWRYAHITQKTHCPLVVIMDSGINARWISPNAEPNAKRKKPDCAGFECHWDGEGFSKVEPTVVFNRIPGDAKQFLSVRRDKLPPDGRKYNPENRNIGIRNVLNQIHGYMDRHEARYGYIVNNEELIFFRRRGKKWGQLDISPAFRHDVEADREQNILNSKYVLFYFHAKYALSDDPKDGWRFQAYGQQRQCELDNMDAKPEKKEDRTKDDTNILQRLKQILQTNKLWPWQMQTNNLSSMKASES